MLDTKIFVGGGGTSETETGVKQDKCICNV